MNNHIIKEMFKTYFIIIRICHFNQLNSQPKKRIWSHLTKLVPTLKASIMHKYVYIVRYKN